jgi:hypothetical protein
MIKDELSLDGNPMLKYVICLFFPFILQWFDSCPIYVDWWINLS